MGAHAVDNFKSVIVLANKCDLISERQRAQLQASVRERMPWLHYAPLVQCSALQGFGLASAMDLVVEAARCRRERIDTHRLNELFQRATLIRPLPHNKRGQPIKI